MLILYNRQNHLNQEQGAVTAFFTVTLVILMIFAALAIDTGTMFHARHVMQKSADAAAISAVSYVIRKGMNDIIVEAGDDSDEAITSLLQTKAREIVISNMHNAGFASTNDTPIEVRVEQIVRDPPDSLNFDVVVNVDRFVNFLFMNAVPMQLLGAESAGQGWQLAVRATSRRTPANIILALDISNSMLCPSSGDCSCMTSQREEGVACASPSKLEDLIVAVAGFLELFDFNSDRIVFVPFAMNAQAITFEQAMQAAFMAGITTSVRPNLIVEDIRPIVRFLLESRIETSSTNISAALLTSYQVMNDHAPDEAWSIILLSDGAPTSARMLLAGNKDSTTPLVSNPQGFGSYDYIHNSIGWISGVDEWIGPSVLMKSGAVSPSYGSPQPPPNSYAGCGPSANPEPVSGSEAHIGAAVMSAISPCLHDLGYRMPDGGHAIANGNKPGDPTGPHYSDWMKQYYNVSVSLSDFLMRQGATIYTIGLGPLAASDSCADSNRDPYQNISDVFSRKQYFLTRLAHDVAEGGYKAVATAGCAHPEFDFTNAESIGQIALNSSGRTGDYLGTSDSANLKKLYQKIGQKILLRLIP